MHFFFITKWNECNIPSPMIKMFFLPECSLSLNILLLRTVILLLKIHSYNIINLKKMPLHHVIFKHYVANTLNKDQRNTGNKFPSKNQASLPAFFNYLNSSKMNPLHFHSLSNTCLFSFSITFIGLCKIVVDWILFTISQIWFTWFQDVINWLIITRCFRLIWGCDCCTSRFIINLGVHWFWTWQTQVKCEY